MIGIYKITSPSGRVYIGQTVNYKKRLSYYKRYDCNKQIRLYASLKKYGFDSHFFEFIENCEIDNLNERERYWQDFYNVCSDRGLNSKLTTTNDRSGILSEFTKLKISESQKGALNHSYGKVSKFKGCKRDREIVEKIAISNRGRKDTMQARLNKSEAAKKKIVSPKARESYSNLHSKLVLDLSSGIFYKNTIEASFAFNIKLSTLHSYLNGYRKNKTTLLRV